MAWYSEGEKVNPAAGDTLATTGKVLTGNNTLATVIVSATVASAVLLEYRDAGATATIRNQILRVPANDTVIVSLGTIALDMAEGLRVLASGITTGNVQASIVY